MGFACNWRPREDEAGWRGAGGCGGRCCFQVGWGDEKGKRQENEEMRTLSGVGKGAELGTFTVVQTDSGDGPYTNDRKTRG